MDAKEVVEKSKALQRATAAGDSPASILSILGELKTGVVPSEDLLRSTKIGVVVNRSKQHKNPEVARLANEIVKKWRDEIQKQKGSPATQPKKPASPTLEKPTFTVAPDQRNHKNDNVDIHCTLQSTRDNCIGLIYNGLCYLSTTAPATILTCAMAVEAAAFTAFGPESNDAYKSKIRSLFQNLKNKSNPALRVRVLGGEISPERFVRMTHEELKSAERRAEDEKLATENMREAMVPQAERSVSSSLQCGKCGQRKVSYSQAQTRSADEPMTTFCECTVCGKRWKVSSGRILGGLCLLWPWASTNDMDSHSVLLNPDQPMIFNFPPSHHVLSPPRTPSLPLKLNLPNLSPFPDSHHTSLHNSNIHPGYSFFLSIPIPRSMRTSITICSSFPPPDYSILLPPKDHRLGFFLPNRRFKVACKRGRLKERKGGTVKHS
jgi:transcription elongation factor S-II